MTSLLFRDEADLLLKSGLHFLEELRRDGEKDDAVPTIRADWRIIAAWLGHTRGPLNAEQNERLENAWAAYLAIGLAPSHQLQSAFDHFSRQIPSPSGCKPPTEVMNVFDRMLATDDQIRQKREADIEAERLRFASVFARHQKQRVSNAGRRMNRTTRSWVFLSSVWFVGVLLYALIFDPFDGGGWGRMSDNETLRVFVVALLPWIGGLLFRFYQRWVR